MKFSGLKLTGVFKVRADSSSKWKPATFCSRSPTGSAAKRTGTPKTVLPSPKRLSPRKPKHAGFVEVIELSPSSSGYFSPAAQWEADEVFKLFDKDGDGKISCSELESVLIRLGQSPTDGEVARMVNDADIDGDGFISLEEFEKLSSVPQSVVADSDLIDAFNVFDTDRDGKISVYELRRVFVALGDEECTLEDCLRMIKGVDGDGDGYVSYEDFVTMMTR